MILCIIIACAILVIKPLSQPEHQLPLGDIFQKAREVHLVQSLDYFSLHYVMHRHRVSENNRGCQGKLSLAPVTFKVIVCYDVFLGLLCDIDFIIFVSIFSVLVIRH